MENGKFYSITQVAQLLGVSDRTVRRLVWKGEIEAVKVGRSVRITGEGIDVFTNDHKFKKNANTPPTKRRFSLQGIIKGGDPIPEEAIDEVIKEWNKEE